MRAEGEALKSVVFMFSGQGSQYYQMGRDLMRNLPSFRKWMEKLDGMFRDIDRDVHNRNHLSGR